VIRGKEISTHGVHDAAPCLTVSLPGMARQVAPDLVDAADQECPYSRVTRGNIDVTIKVV